MTGRKPSSHCRRGHEFTDANTIHHAGGTRSCRECTRRRKREWAFADRRRRGVAPMVRKEPAPKAAKPAPASKSASLPVGWFEPTIAKPKARRNAVSRSPFDREIVVVPNSPDEIEAARRALRLAGQWNLAPMLGPEGATT